MKVLNEEHPLSNTFSHPSLRTASEMVWVRLLGGEA